jgi:hypothetical protein
MNPVRKSNRRYLFYRAFCTTTLVAWLVVGIYTFFALMYYGWEEPAAYSMFVLVGLVPMLFQRSSFSTSSRCRTEP